MDNRNGQLYHNSDDARLAGVPAEHIEPVQVMTINKGPFKGRSYVVGESGALGRRVYPPKESE